MTTNWPARRGPFVLLGAWAASLTGCALPVTAVGTVVTQGRVEGVRCQIAVWSGDIGPIDGRGTPLATIETRTGQSFDIDLSLVDAHDEMLWASFECDGFVVKVRPLDTERAWFSILDLGRVWVPRRESDSPADASGGALP